MKKKTLVNLITGFLGAGKTTLMRNVLERQTGGEKVAVLVNELGEVGIDGAILKRPGLNLIELTNGCICCEIQGDMRNSVEDLVRTYKPDRLLIEATGVAEPSKILDLFNTNKTLLALTELEPVICVVGADAFFQLMRFLAFNYACQITVSDLLLLNKTDLADEKTLRGIEKQIHEMNPRTFIVRTQRCEVDLAFLLKGEGLRDASRPSKSARGDPRLLASHNHLKDFVSFTYDSNGAVFDRPKLEAYLKKLPNGLFRLKGFLHFKTGCHLLNYTTGHFEIEKHAKVDSAHLVFIGRGLDKKKLLSDLQKCFAKGKKEDGRSSKRVRGR